jgi:CheY-like chemotaxis protein
VLLVEDNPVNQEVARSMLRLLGVDVDAASDGPQALQALLERRYDAVFMDCMMPGLDGFEVTAAFREAEHRSQTGGRTPIIALTASATTADRTRCLAMGMDDFVTKPFRLADLEAALSRWVPAGAVPFSPTTDPEPAATVVA